MIQRIKVKKKKKTSNNNSNKKNPKPQTLKQRPRNVLEETMNELKNQNRNTRIPE